MVFLWSDIQALLEEREGKLLDVMDLAEKFWCDHGALIITIKDSQDLLKELEEPGVDPSVVKQQQEFVEVERFKFKINSMNQPVVFFNFETYFRDLRKSSMGCKKSLMWFKIRGRSF